LNRRDAETQRLCVFCGVDGFGDNYCGFAALEILCVSAPLRFTSLLGADQAANPVLYERDIEIDQQSEPSTGELQVGEKLGVMNG
jgi:hypothetical protein